jgi:redox-sensitive bicupin YhaK (pirin superfamily)
MWIIKLQSNAEWILPATSPTANRSLYVVNGTGIKIGPQLINVRNQVELIPDIDVTITDTDGGTKLLLLQGEPIAEPIVKHGPFVMNTQSEIRQAYYDYQNTQFGGWIWGKDDPVHGKEFKRFAKLVDGREEQPG